MISTFTGRIVCRSLGELFRSPGPGPYAVVRSADCFGPLKAIVKVAMLVLLLAGAGLAQNNVQDNMNVFITRAGNKLMEGNQEYRFISFNIPNLHLIEDNMAFTATNEWRFPDEFEITDALMSIKRMGGRAARMYVISICRPDAPNPIPCHVQKPGQFNEAAWAALDKVLEVANRTGVRVIIPLVDNWRWWGGISEYAAWRGKAADAFWRDPEVIGDFKETVKYALNRRNTFTGTLYRDDKAILAWETGNEIYSPYAWTREIAAYIKSLDANHLVWDGFYIGNNEIEPKALDDPNIDIVSSHHYPSPIRPNIGMVADIRRFQLQIGEKKVYVVGEFGFIPLPDVENLLNAVISRGVSGAMIWSLRFHNRDGGFYWHSEGAGGDLYKAYHYPGFRSGNRYDETALIKLITAKAAQIRGLPEPAFAAPEPPVLLPVKSTAAISWRGSVGATSYDVERSASTKGPWTIAGKDVDDSLAQYRPLFNDGAVVPGHNYFYRVRAKNSDGISLPSNVSGPVAAAAVFLVDELADLSQVLAHGGALSIERTGARPYKEDMHRLKGTTDSWITYQVPRRLRTATIFTFMEGAEKDFEFLVSGDGQQFVTVTPAINHFPATVNPYGYKLPVRYDLAVPEGENRFLKIVFKTEAQIGRVEIGFR